MANDEHVALLKQGVAAWNAWRDEHPDVVSPNLHGADLQGADLRGADLKGAELFQANLNGFQVVTGRHLKYSLKISY